MSAWHVRECPAFPASSMAGASSTKLIIPLPCNRQGSPLAPPTTWAQFKDVAEFFTRPDKGRYGTTLFYAGPTQYDMITMGFDQVLWSFGGELRDSETGNVEGTLNNQTGVDALRFYAQDLKP